MGQPSKPLTPEKGPDHLWGFELRSWRQRRRLSLSALGRLLPCDPSYLAKIERTERKAALSLAEACDRALNAEGALLRLHQALLTPVGDVAKTPHDVAIPGPVLGKTAGGEESSDDEGIVVPCRLQDGRMAFVTVPRRVFLHGGAGLGALTALGIAGSSLTAAASDEGLRLTRRVRQSPYGPTPIEHLRRLRRLLIDNDNLLGPRQVIATVHQQVAVIQELRKDSDGADRRQLLEMQTQFAEFASWLHQDLGEHQAAGHWLDRALQWSHTVGDVGLTSYVMARKSQLAGEVHDLVDVVDLAEASRNMAPPRSRLAAVGLTYEAFGHALRGESSAAERAFDQAHSTAENLRGDPGPWGVWLDVSYVEVHRAQGLEALGRHDQAAAAFADAIKRLPAGYHRDRGVYLARQAVAHAGAGAPEQAATVGLQALTVAEDTGSARILHDLTRLDTALRPWQTLAEVNDFRTALDSVVLHEA